MDVNKEQKANLLKWCEALESDLYEQGQGCLRDSDDKYCCLGVALNTIAPDGWNKQITEAYIGKKVYSHAGGKLRGFYEETPSPKDRYNYLTQKSRELFGIDNSQMLKLVHLNDQQEPFKVISKYIRDNFLNDK